MSEIIDVLRCSVEIGASDIFIGVGRCIAFKLNGSISPYDDNIIDFDKAAELVSALYDMAGKNMDNFNAVGDDDFIVSIKSLARFRINAYKQRGTVAVTIRVVQFSIPDFKGLHIPDEVMKVALERRGLTLVTGAAGSGKTTTLACIVNTINRTRNCHIITLEDPIEYLHRDDKSLISQREINIDTDSYITALRACLRQAPDIILLGEMRDQEAIQAAITSAETGHLVISTLHTTSAVNTIDRIIDVFPPSQQQQVRVQLSMLIQTVITQQLLPLKGGGLIPAFEIMHANKAIRNLIRESKIHQIDNVIQTSSQEGMVNMDASILRLYNSGMITAETAVAYSINADQMANRVRLG